MKPYFLLWLRRLSLVLAAFLVSCGNILSSGQNSDASSAVQYSFELALGTGKWNEAITHYGELTATQQATRINVFRLASALAGRCGLNTVRLADLIANGTGALPLGRIYSMFSNKSAASALSAYNDCVDSVSTLATLGATADLRSADENVLMILVELAKISALAAYRGDTTPQDGSVDATFNPCEDADAYGNLTVSDQNQIAYAIGNIKDSFDQLPTTIPFVKDFRTTFNTICTTLAGAGTDLCGVRSTTTMTAGLRLAARAIIAEGSVFGYNRPTPAASGSDIAVTYLACNP